MTADPSVAETMYPLVAQLHASPYATNEDFCHVKRNVLKRHWEEAMEVIANLLLTDRSIPLSSVTKRGEEWLDRLIGMHQEKGRFYHTAVHLEEILGYLDIIVHHEQKRRQEQQQQLESWHVAVLIFATFFHDAVYDTHSSTNEEDSAKLFESFFQEVCTGDPPSLTAGRNENGEDTRDLAALLSKIHSLVVQIILATKRHEIPPLTKNAATNKDDDDDALISRWLFATFLDLDMAVLAKERHAYLEYANLIRLEYHWVPREVYCETRANILQGFVDRNTTKKDDDGDNRTSAATIYLSPELQAAWEERAKSNLRAEIALLRQGVIPGDDEDGKSKQHQDDTA